MAIVVIDCIGLLYPEVQRIQELASAGVDGLVLPPERIVVTSTHTHSGPDVVGIWGPEQTISGRDPDYIDFLVKTAAQQIVRAAEQLQPVSGRFGQSGFGEEWVSNICEPEEVDRTLSVLQFRNAENVPVVTLTNFACHPTFFDGVHDVVSADYVGGYYRQMRTTIPGTHLFLQGAIGGWVQPDKGDRSFELGFRRGEELAQTVTTLLAGSEQLRGKGIAFRTKELRMPVANPGWQQLSQLGIIDRSITDGVTTRMAWFRIGEAQFITHPGETPPAYSLIARDLMNTSSGPKMIMGLTYDALGYILKPIYFEEPAPPHAGYLTGMSVGPAAGPLVVRTMEELIPR